MGQTQKNMMGASIALSNRNSLGKRIWKHKVIYLFMLPAILWFLVFCYYPMYGLLLAFKDYKFSLGILGSPWVGLKWFRQFLMDPSFWQIVLNTVKISLLKLCFGFPAPIILALMLNSIRSTRFKRLAQTISYMPHFVSWVVVSAMLHKLLSPYGGALNELRMMLDPTAKSIYYMGQVDLFYPIAVISDIWKEVGWGTIIYLAALSSVDLELYEAAAIDGARPRQLTLHITLPFILPTVCIMLIMSLGGILNAGFEQLLLLQTTPTSSVAEIIDTYVLRRGLTKGSFSYSTGIGLLKSVLTLLLVTAVNALSRRVAEVSLW